jgi:hypothetical protein
MKYGKHSYVMFALMAVGAVLLLSGVGGALVFLLWPLSCLLMMFVMMRGMGAMGGMGGKANHTHDDGVTHAHDDALTHTHR